MSPSIELELEYHVATNTRDFDRINRAALWVAQTLNIKKIIASIAIVDDAAIQKVNSQHLGHDWPTDVVSLVFESAAEGVEGEVIASWETAARLSYLANWPVEDELLLYVIHGLLHICGLDDRQPSEQRIMREMEQACLHSLGVDASDHLAKWNDITY
ncbi:MAG: rRNA maturation RNase YbeY [Planctomycetales bacterium]|nr:rRNA maturation RNase YbeY [Planctomycetales bacterium]